ncbi:MAG: hypothetical protein AAFY28_03860 [Actinomycetota bacterium]
MRLLRTRAWSAIAVWLALSGCSSAPDATESTESDIGVVPEWFADELQLQESVDLSCAGIPTDGPPAEFEIVADAVALPASPNHAALQTSGRESADGDRYFFAKTGLVWNTAASFELVVPEEFRPTMAIGWGGPAPHAHRVVVQCAGPDEWVAMPGGYWVTEPICADVIVGTADVQVTVQIGLGTPCPLQAPPQGPSDD